MNTKELIDKGYELDQKIKKMQIELKEIKEELKKKLKNKGKVSGKKAFVELIYKTETTCDPKELFKVVSKKDFFSLVSVNVCKTKEKLGEDFFNIADVKQGSTAIYFKSKK